MCEYVGDCHSNLVTNPIFEVLISKNGEMLRDRHLIILWNVSGLLSLL